MKQDINLLNRLHHGLCEAIERDRAICFVKKKAKGYCKTHYERWRRLGCIDLPLKMKKKCKFIDCDNKYHAKGYCKTHHARYHLRAHAVYVPCIIEGCIKKRKGREYCSMHAERIRVHGDPLVKKNTGWVEAQKARKYKTKKPCLNPDCSNNAIAKGLCGKHYMRWYTYGDYKKESRVYITK